MIRNILIALALLTSFACGGTPEDDFDDSADFGTVEQPFTGKKSPSFGYGIQTGSGRNACVTTSSGQACAVPSTKTFNWCVNTGNGILDASIASSMNHVLTGDTVIGGVPALNGTGFVWNHKPDGAGCTIGVSGVNVLINAGAVCSGGSTSTSVDAFVCYNPSFDAILTETELGSYQLQTGAIIHVDSAKISTRTAAIVAAGCAGSGAPSCNAASVSQNITMAGLARSMSGTNGLGGRSDAGAASSWTRNALFPLTNARVYTAGEKCRAVGYSTLPATNSFSYVFGACATD